MADALRMSLLPLKKSEGKPAWKPKLPRGVISQDSYEASRGRKASWKPR